MFLALSAYMLTILCVVTEHIRVTTRAHPHPRRFAYPNVKSYNAVQHTRQMTDALGMCV